ncbi:MAG: CvpA family protein [Sphaerochaetaceae bacterium]|jgi:membrane protein required for colicin V production
MGSWSVDLGFIVLNIVDLIVLVLLLLGAIVGTAKGFSKEFGSRLGFIVGFIVALFLSQLGAQFLMNTFELKRLVATIIAYVVLFILGYILMMAVGNLLEKALSAVGLKWLDRLLGLLLGMFEIVVVVAVVLQILDNSVVQSLIPSLKQFLVGSEAYKLLNPMSSHVIEKLIHLFNG